MRTDMQMCSATCRLNWNRLDPLTKGWRLFNVQRKLAAQYLDITDGNAVQEVRTS